MKILISGSRRNANFTGDIAAFEKACEKIGAVLAENGYSIIVGSEDPETADLHVVRGYCSSSCSCKDNKDIRLKVYAYRANGEPVPYEDIKSKENIKEKVAFQNYESTGEWWVNRVDQVKNADCVLLICGGAGTLQSGLIAPTLEKPVVAVCCFNGSAKEVWGKIESRYKDNKKVIKLSNLLKGDWEDGKEKHIIEMIDIIKHVDIYHNIRNVTARFLKIIYPVAVSLFVGLWLLLFCKPIAQKTICLFGLMCISSVLGTVTRNALSFLSEDSDIIKIGKIFIEIGVSLVIGIGLTWVYFIFNGILTGDFDFSLLDDPKNFQRISVIMSIIGLYSGFSLSEASGKLSKLLSESISSEIKK